jgi:hypothetical protein
MNMPFVDFSTKFGRKIIELQCPECNQIYHISEDELQEGRVSCWNNWMEHGQRKHCGAQYIQKYQKTSEIQFVRKAIHNCKP